MAEGINKADIAAFKKAEAISFHTYEGRSYIRATIRGREPTDTNPFRTSDQCRETDCEHVLRDYSEHPNILPQDAKFRAFEMIHSAQWCDQWQTIANVLREGDLLTLKWGRNARKCLNYDVPNYVGDSLHLSVWRSGKKLAFLIDIYVGPDNSARMIRAA